PATPYIYPLSLHDALPIFHGEAHAATSGTHHAHDALHERALAIAIGAKERHRLPLADVERDAVQRAHGAVARLHVADQKLKRQGDRKSTRLNSSHDQISYA